MGLQLPVELLYSIVTCVKGQKELLALCMTSRVMYGIAQGYLYKSLRIYRGYEKTVPPGMQLLKPSDHLKLYKALQNQSISKLVTEFRINFQPCSGVALQGINAPCRCDEFDAMLGQALEGLEHLQIFAFRCNCCDSTRQRHQYLNELKCRQLNQLIFWCSCCSYHQYSTDSLAFLNKPPMSTVTSCSLELVPVFASKVFAREDCLPALKKVSCYDPASIGVLLAKGTLTHIVCQTNFDNEDFAIVLLNMSAQVVHFVVSNPAKLFSLGTNSSSYQNIRHLGILLAGSTRQNDSEMTRDVLPSFPRLHSIEVSLRDFPILAGEDQFFSFFSDTGYFKDIEQSRTAPTLKKVYIYLSARIGNIKHACWICSLQDSGWKLQRAPNFTSWDVMHAR